MKAKRNSSSWLEIFSGLILLAVIVLTATGCAVQGKETAIGAEANDTEVTVKVGDVLAINLASNPSTGYSWQLLDVDAKVLTRYGDPEFLQEGVPGMVGQGGAEILRFEALSVGSTTLSLGYQRPWETDVEPIEFFTVVVNVVD